MMQRPKNKIVLPLLKKIIWVLASTNYLFLVYKFSGWQHFIQSASLEIKLCSTKIYAFPFVILKNDTTTTSLVEKEKKCAKGADFEFSRSRLLSHLQKVTFLSYQLPKSVKVISVFLRKKKSSNSFEAPFLTPL